MFCSECGSKNEKQALFCSNCGAKFEQLKLTEKSKESKSILKSKLIKITIILVFGMMILITVGKALLGLNDPTMKILFGSYRLLKDNSPEMSMTITFEDTPRDYDFLKELEIKISNGEKKKDLSGLVAISYDGKSIAKTGLAYQDGYLFLDFKELYDEVLYYDLDEFEDYIDLIFQYKAYLEDFKIKGVNWKKYANTFTDAMGDSLVKDGKEVVLTLDMSDIFDSFEIIANIARDDDDLKDGIREGLIDLFEQMIEDNFEYDGNDAETWDSFLEFLDDDYDWNTAYDDFFEDVDYFFQRERAYYEFIPFDDQEIRFSFSGTKLSHIKCLIEESGFEMLIDFDLRHGYHAKSYKLKKAENIENYDYYELQEITSDIAYEIRKNISKNNTLMKDIGKSEIYEDYEYYNGVSDVDEFLDTFLYEVLDELRLLDLF